MGTDVFEIYHRKESYRREPTKQIYDPTPGDLILRSRELKRGIRDIVKVLSLGNKERLLDFATELLTSQNTAKIPGNGGNK
jgi:hypothetical protein